MLGWALRASSKLLFFSTRTSSSSGTSALLATARVQRSSNFSIVSLVRGSSRQRDGSCGYVRLRSSGGESVSVHGFFLVQRLGESCCFVSTATNVAPHAETGGVGLGAHAHLLGRKQFVLKCDWTVEQCTWKWMSCSLLRARTRKHPHTSTHVDTHIHTYTQTHTQHEYTFLCHRPFTRHLDLSLYLNESKICKLTCVFENANIREESVNDE